jgi:hypothetical protein
MSFQPSPTDLNDSNQPGVYTWRIGNVNLSNVSITCAPVTFANMANWDNNPNMLLVWLLDAASNSGVETTQDVNPKQIPVTDISDFFASANLPPLVSSSTLKTDLFHHSFTTTPTTSTLIFDDNELASAVLH